MNSLEWWWRLLVSGTLLSIVGFGIATWLLKQGIADPTQSNDIYWQDDNMPWAQGIGQLLPDHAHHTRSPVTLPNMFMLQVEAVFDGEADLLANWGVWIEVDGNWWLIVALNNIRHVTARMCPADYTENLIDCIPLLEPNQHINTVWKTYHHIHPAGQPNQIQLACQHGLLSLRLNGEWMWDLPVIPGEQWGLWAQGGTEKTASLDWIRTKIATG